MEKTFEKIEELATHVKEYVNNRIAAIKISTAEKVSALLANILAKTILLLFFLFFLLFASLALAFGLEPYTGGLASAFLLVAGLYLLLSILVWYGRENLLRRPILHALLTQLFTKQQHDEEVE